MIALKESEHGITFAVRVQPRAGRAGIKGIHGDGENAALKFALSAPPVDGQANQELVERLADLLEVSKLSVNVVAGARSRNKIVRIRGCTLAKIQSILETALVP